MTLGPVHECGTKKLYNVEHDAYYCPKCRVWAQPKCCPDGEVCDSGYCTDRPEFPPVEPTE